MKVLLAHIILLLTSITLTARSLTCKRLYYGNAGFFDGGMNSTPTDQCNTFLVSFKIAFSTEMDFNS